MKSCPLFRNFMVVGRGLTWLIGTPCTVLWRSDHLLVPTPVPFGLYQSSSVQVRSSLSMAVATQMQVSAAP